MVLDGYGVRLRRLTEDDIEMVRCWRNDPKIRQYMNYREEITPEMQKKWFAGIDNENNYYFVIEWRGKDVGLIDTKDIDYGQMSGEAGLFIYDDECLRSDVPVRASLLHSDFVWNTLGLEKLRIHILRDNVAAQRYNRFFGFKLLPGQEDVENQEYVLTRAGRDAALKRTDRMREILSKDI